MDESKIKRINELAKKAKTVELTDKEKEEQLALRQEYIKAFRNNLKSTLDSIVVVDRFGNKKAIRKNEWEH